MSKNKGKNDVTLNRHVVTSLITLMCYFEDERYLETLVGKSYFLNVVISMI